MSKVERYSNKISDNSLKRVHIDQNGRILLNHGKELINLKVMKILNTACRNEQEYSVQRCKED